MKKNDEKMKEYLDNHFRYNTMNSWNNCTNYAANVKINNFVPRELLDKAYEMISIDRVYREIDAELEEFAQFYDYRYQIGFNGRSNGYLVLYLGGAEKTDKGLRVWSSPGKSLEYDEETLSDLAEVHDIVKHFDETVETCKQIFIDFCKRYDIIEEEVMVPKTIKVLKEAAA